ncbi:DUF6443 domain-containing protein [Chryseobacterium sp. ISL-6]|uniref:DUF6443 domain-containing protein n=1 Tax=Chryseobacterium sp. ISL-6 TaxID=2819143 RepID=UPI001BE4FB57|nr:DUF6443 domain-containing protein [Chryseobacterium sp. ISL-6]MBT2622609.1 RHS repeat-associated core domain-containing protein [Chryseobacterium sp. ISL-6]
MKKINQIIYVGALLIASLAHAQLSPTENYVYSKTYLSDPTLPNVRTSETVQYFDGLGRPKQVVNIKASPLGRDVVTPIVYDGFGKQTRDYLPVPQQSTTNGAIYGQNSGLVPLPISDPTGVYPAGEKVYTEKELEKSPLDRILEQRQVGTAWTTKPILFGYLANTATDVRKYITTTDPVEGRTNSKLKVSPNDANSASGYYKANQLYKNSVKDEDGNETIEFKNGQGQTVLVRKVISATDNADTYYIYNEYNQLAFVIPPKASFAIKGLAAGTQIVETDPILTDLCYQYRYDGKNRLVEKKVPGKGAEYMVYDKADQLIMTQDAELRKKFKWLVTKYDQFGRVLYTGIFASLEGRPSLQNLLNNYVITEYRNAQGFTKNGMQIYYSNNFLDIETALSVNYYDSYLIGDPFPTLVLDQSVLPSDVQQYGRSTKGLPVSNYVKNIEDDNWTKTYLYYDLKGRGIREFALNHLGGYTNVERQLDFAGIPQKTITKHQRLSSDTPRTITELFTYDPQNRLLTHTHQVDSNPVEILTQNKYNELSQLESKKVGGISATSPLQQIDYKYNIRGWMTQINDPTTLGSDLFGYKINYNQVEGLETPDAFDTGLKVKPKYNGNIAEVSWKTLFEENEPLKRYGYVYDPLNRLTAGFYQKAGTESGREYFEKLEYDLNGNITRLKRSEGILAGNTTAEMIDNLKYDYSGNRLTTVTEEQILNSKGYPYLAAPNAIGYDLNGNMINHKDKGLSSIQYNYLNLPKQITQNADVTNYIYRADGVKVKKLFKNLETNYLDGFQYKSTFSIESWDGEGTYHPDPNEIPILKLRIIPTAEGYYDALKEGYVYNFTDHLGNVRLSYTDTNKDGIIQPRAYECNSFSKGGGGGGCINPWKPGEIIDINNYYPFGMLHSYTTTSQNAYQYKYNGKELQETGMYDYGARFYMPDIGRWGVIDPKSQYTHEAYNYVWNNPIIFADPTGMTGEISDWIHNPKTGKYRWDPNVTGPGNTPAGWDYVGKTGSYKIEGATVQLLEGGKTFTDINEVAVSGVSPAAAGIVLSQNARFGLFAFLAVASWYVISDFVDTNPTYQPTRIDPMMYKHTDNAESNAGSESSVETDSTDVNGVDVPDARKGGGKNGQHANLKAKQSAGEKYEEAKSKLDSISRKPNKTKEDNKLKVQLEKQVKHWKAKAQETGENHSRNAKGNR